MSGHNGSSKASVLLVEDHTDTRNITRRVLERSGYAVTAVGSAAEALEQVGRQAFGVMLFDIGLPDASGWDLLRQVRDVRPITAVVMSGFGMAEDVKQSLDAGACEHLTKPINLKQLVAAIERCVATAVPAA